MDTLWKDLRYASRILFNNPGFAIVATLILAMGIGSGTAIFSVVDACSCVRFRMKIPTASFGSGRKPPEGLRSNVSPANFLDWRGQATVFDRICATAAARFILSNVDQPEQYSGLRVSADFFDLLGVEPALGRSFLPEEDRPGHEKVVVLSHGLWRSRFGADPKLVGKTVTLNGETYTVVGVLPSGFRFRADRYQLWTPIALDRREAGRNTHYLKVVARLKSNATIEQSRAEMETVAAGIAEVYPETEEGWSVTVEPLQEWLVDLRTRESLLILFGAVGFLLLIACVNVSNLLLARAYEVVIPESTRYNIVAIVERGCRGNQYY